MPKHVFERYGYNRLGTLAFECMDLLEQEKERLLRKYGCQTIQEVIILIESRLKILESPLKSSKVIIAPPGGEPFPVSRGLHQSSSVLV